ncbi:MAG: aspartate kinase [Balneolaceae bacterium]|nr:aspartate kinase [Balneolaceae bacterium]
MDDIRVLKFGGTSMGDEQTWRRVLSIAATYERSVIVVSATSHTTRQLLAAAESALEDVGKALEISLQIRQRHETLIDRFLEQFDPAKREDAGCRCREVIAVCTAILENHLKGISNTGTITAARKDAVASLGEQLSSRLFAICARVFGLKTCFIDARDIIKTDSDFGKANPDTAKIEARIPLVASRVTAGEIPVIGGYYGENEEGAITTLGFEGSDYTASLVGAALECDAIEIWTDVNGIYTCDPGVVEGASPIPEISFREATEMAYFGARVLHPSTLKPASEKGIPVYVRNIFEPEHPGTKIFSGAESNGPVRAITYLEQVVIVTVHAPSTLMGYHLLSNVFQVLELNHMLVDVVKTTESSVSIAL